jgi:hypothetical protein
MIINVGHRLQARRLTDDEEIVAKLKSSLEDLSAACILEAFGNPDRMVLVDAVIKELGSYSIWFVTISGLYYKSTR